MPWHDSAFIAGTVRPGRTAPDGALAAPAEPPGEPPFPAWRYRVSVAERQVAGKPGLGPAPRGGKRAGDQRAGDKPAGDKPAGDQPASGGGEYPGQWFGLPESGSGSAAGVVRRLGALMIDWLMSVVIALAILGGDKHPASTQYLAVAVFAAEIYLLTALTGFTVGKRLLGLRVVRLDGKPVGLLWALVRTVLFLLVIPALVLDGDLRGLHDKAARTIVIRI
jgi:hypothetical protein